jgi:DNA-binding Xre family transcriptional regulator
MSITTLRRRSNDRAQYINDDVLDVICGRWYSGFLPSGVPMITAAQLRAARALLSIDQRELAELSGVSLPTIQRMEASNGNVRGVIDTLTKIVEALDAAGVELIGENVKSVGSGRGVRFKRPKATAGS